MKNLFINIFHEDDLSELEMEEILAGNTCGEFCMCNGSKYCICNDVGSYCNCNDASKFCNCNDSTKNCSCNSTTSMVACSNFELCNTNGS